MDSIVFMNNAFMDGACASISPLDLAVLRGFGVMDYLRTYDREPFHLEAHIRRFIFSANEIGLSVPKTPQQIQEIVRELICRIPNGEVGVKLVLTGGSSEDQLVPTGNPVFFAVAYPFHPFPKECFAQGVSILTTEHQRPFPKAKTTQYLPSIVALQKAQKVGAIDVLFYDENGWIRETTTANFFAVKNGKIITPKNAVLEGVTRRVVLELCDVEQRDIHRDEIVHFEGAFLASSNKEIMPVIKIDDIIINNNRISSVVLEVMSVFNKKTSKTIKKLLHNM